MHLDVEHSEPLLGLDDVARDAGQRNADDGTELGKSSFVEDRQPGEGLKIALRQPIADRSFDLVERDVAVDPPDVLRFDDDTGARR